MTKIYAPAGLSGAPLAELKQWLAVTTDTDDTLLEGLLGAAHAMCTRFTGLIAFKSEVRETFAADRLAYQLRTAPVLYFVDATAIDQNFDRRLLQETEVSFERCGDEGGRMILSAPISEPQVEAHFYAGLADEWDQVDEGLRHGIIRYAAHQYRERESGPTENPPASVAALWRPYRRMHL